MCRGHDVGARERDCRRDELRSNAPPHRNRLRRGELAAHDLSLLRVHGDRDEPGLFLESHREAGADLAERSGAREDERSSDIRVAGKRYFPRRSEDPDVTRLTRLGGKHERGLGEVELARDLLHLLLRQAIGLRQHCERISAEARFREHVAGVVAVSH